MRQIIDFYHFILNEEDYKKIKKYEGPGLLVYETTGYVSKYNPERDYTEYKVQKLYDVIAHQSVLEKIVNELNDSPVKRLLEDLLNKDWDK